MWKGTVHEDMYITTPPTGGSCGFTFVEGEEYIVYGYDSNYDDGGYTVGICSRTALLGLARADLEAFGEGQAPLVGTGGPAPDTTAGHATRGCESFPAPAVICRHSGQQPWPLASEQPLQSGVWAYWSTVDASAAGEQLRFLEVDASRVVICE